MRGLTPITAYLSATADVVKSVTDPGNRITTFAYDIRGRQTKTILPDQTETTTTYTTLGEVSGRSGSQTYPVTYTYDYAGRQRTMTTYGTETATTTWEYSPTRGWLDRKEYSDGNGTEYDYTDAGRLETRTWERGVTATYGYDGGGRMAFTDYSNETNGYTTPDVITTYDALGRPLTVKNGTGTVVNGEFTIASPLSSSSFLYNSGNLATDTETITYNLPGQTAFTRVLDRSQDTLGRNDGWELIGTAVEHATSYGYDTAGRLRHVDPTYPLPESPATPAFSYTYESNSYSLVKTVTGPAHTVVNTWESGRNVLLNKVNHTSAPASPVSKYDYAVNGATSDGANEIGQRKNLSMSGSAFSASRDIAWSYDPLGQVIGADSTIPGLSRAYEYDMIGNRVKSADSLTLPPDDNYTPNALNQYTAVNAFNPTHDPDGNQIDAQILPLASPGLVSCVFTWDAENRLVEVKDSSDNILVRYSYDARSRRIAETVGSVTRITVYDGWNPIAIYTGSALEERYLWGMDLSGSMQGAGGVGGLLAVSQGTGTYYPTYDGNGNVSEYLDSAGVVQAHYECDPFGRTTVATGPKANDFAHRFSTKPLDAATGLYYYGYRWYDPLTGRWPSRDPMGERGGLNLYGFVDNSPLVKLDRLGLEIILIKVLTASEQVEGSPERTRWLQDKELYQNTIDAGNTVMDEFIASIKKIDDEQWKTRNWKWLLNPGDGNKGDNFSVNGTDKQKILDIAEKEKSTRIIELAKGGSKELEALIKKETQNSGEYAKVVVLIHGGGPIVWFPEGNFENTDSVKKMCDKFGSHLISCFQQDGLQERFVFRPLPTQRVLAAPCEAKLRLFSGRREYVKEEKQIEPDKEDVLE